jgi:hypothetical protein
MSSRKSLVIGILIGLAVVGCIAAIDGSTGTPRYQVIVNNDVTTNVHSCWVLDTETGTVNYLVGDTSNPRSVVFPFEQVPAE